MEENCDYNLPIGLCITGNICGYISNCIWFLVLLPQLYKNYKRKTTEGLSLIWAFCNFTASLINVFFVFFINVPIFSKVGGVYMPILEFLILIQFFIYHNVSFMKKMYCTIFFIIIWIIIILIEILKPFGFDTNSKLVWISIILWSIETFPQVFLNMKNKSIMSQSKISLILTFIGKTTDFISQYSLIMPQQYVYMTYFSSTLAYINIFQLILYHVKKRYKYFLLLKIFSLLITFIVFLILRLGILSIICPIIVILVMIIFYLINKNGSKNSENLNII
jgi:hypothetical protein